MTLNEKYALAIPKIGRVNRKRYSKAKNFALRIVSTSAIAGLIYWTLKR